MALVWDQRTQKLFCPYRLSPAASEPSREGNSVPTTSLMLGCNTGGCLPLWGCLTPVWGVVLDTRLPQEDRQEWMQSEHVGRCH